MFPSLGSNGLLHVPAKCTSCERFLASHSANPLCIEGGLCCQKKRILVQRRICFHDREEIKSREQIQLKNIVLIGYGYTFERYFSVTDKKKQLQCSTSESL